jgi:hypothetical protein
MIGKVHPPMRRLAAPEPDKRLNILADFKDRAGGVRAPALPLEQS